jgi:uncharacterized protein YndB with AHSA1/START domain
MAQEQGAQTGMTTKIYEIYIRATPQAIWDAITTPEWSAKYGYGGLVEYDLRPGGRFVARANAPMVAAGVPEVAIDGEVLEATPPRKLVQTYRFLFSDAMKSEGFTTLIWEIEPTQSGFCKLRVTHELAGAPIMAQMVTNPFSEMGGGGWSWILSDLKSVLETGKAMGQ